MQIEIVRRHELGPRGWNLAVDAAPLGWWWHREEWIDYSRAYAPGSEDRSFVVAIDGNIALVAPLVVLNRQVQTGGQPFGAAPLFLFADGAPLDVVAAVAKCASDEAHRHADDAGRLALRPTPVLTGVAAPPPGMHRADRLTHVVPLGDDAEMLRRFRKSYRQAARKGGSSVLVHGVNARAEMSSAQALHLKAAGRATRSDETWQLMGRWLDDGHALLAVSYGPCSEPEGYAYAIRYKQWSYYASGAVPGGGDTVGPALQFQMMRALARDGERRFYELGLAASSGADEKERNISFFKSGFGGGLWHVPAIDYDYKRRAVAPPVGGVRRTM